jgi:hypothetical protein
LPEDDEKLEAVESIINNTMGPATTRFNNISKKESPASAIVKFNDMIVSAIKNTYENLSLREQSMNHAYLQFLQNKIL